LILYCRFKW